MLAPYSRAPKVDLRSATLTAAGAVSSVGRAPARQAGGHWFEPSTAHKRKPRKSGVFSFSENLLKSGKQGLLVTTCEHEPAKVVRPARGHAAPPSITSDAASTVFMADCRRRKGSRQMNVSIPNGSLIVVVSGDRDPRVILLAQSMGDMNAMDAMEKRLDKLNKLSMGDVELVPGPARLIAGRR